MTLLRRLWPFGRGQPGGSRDHDERVRDRETRRRRTQLLTGQIHEATLEAHRVVGVSRADRDRTIRERFAGLEREGIT